MLTHPFASAHRLTIAIAAVSAIGGCARTIPVADSSIANGITSPLNTDVLLGSDADQPATTVPKATRTPSREHVAITGSAYVQGRSRVLVQAPIATVRRRVLKFRDYAKFMPHYRASVVLGKLPDGNKRVYMQVAALRESDAFLKHRRCEPNTDLDAGELGLLEEGLGQTPLVQL